MMVAGGIVAGVLLIFIEIAYKRHRGLKEKELELARNAADRWRGNIEVSYPYVYVSLLVKVVILIVLRAILGFSKTLVDVVCFMSLQFLLFI